jgi:glutaminase
MYDHSGTWVYEVGLPAKSGVAGGIVAVLPGQFGIGVFSPRLDVRGNSARGVAVCKKLASDLSLHFLLPPRPAQATLRASHSLAKLRSRRRRSGPQQACLDTHGPRALVLELQGDLRFAGAERIARKMTEASGELDCCVLDFRRVTDVDPAASLIIVDLVRRFGETDKAVIFADVRQDALRNALSSLPPSIHEGLQSPQMEVELDRALERAEELLLARFGDDQASRKIPRLTLAAHDLCAGMTEKELVVLGDALESLACEPGTLVVKRGDPADALYLLVAGEVSVLLGLPDGTQRRLGTLSAGMGFGEAALLTQGIRSADIRADSPVECYRLSISSLRVLETEAPGLVIKLLTNLLRTSTAITARLTAEVSSLAS